MRLVNHPVLCNYYVTYRCNASCHFCDIWEKPSPYVQIDEVEKNLDSLKNLGVKIIDFTGGEPLLHRDLDKLLELAKNKGFLTTVTTNTLLYPKQAKKLAGKVDMLHFSLDYFDAAKHNKARGVTCYDFVMESIDIAKSLGERPDILFTAMPDNLNDLAPIYHEIALPNNLVLIINPMFSYGDVGEKLNKDHITFLRSWGKKSNIYLNQAFLDLIEDGGNQSDHPVCKAASSTIVISPFNELVLPCYHLGKKSYPVNNNLEKLYKSEEVQAQVAMEGRWAACNGCTVNCYMQPSFAVEFNKYWLRAFPSTFKYNLMKGTWKKAVFS